MKRIEKEKFKKRISDVTLMGKYTKTPTGGVNSNNKFFQAGKKVL
jgi:hypothetical protein